MSNFIQSNYRRILLDSVFMFFVMIGSNAIANFASNEPALGTNPGKMVLFAALLSLPAGLGYAWLNRKSRANKS
ncbi:MAG: hypothetical protein H6608_07850 [Flavobacteriales bacterium]|nr:hypothetical protein [Bacteroidota bacterium]MCB9241029.1 hypothetical protein [Flavobacteriales bacterium]